MVAVVTAAPQLKMIIIMDRDSRGISTILWILSHMVSDLSLQAITMLTTQIETGHITRQWVNMKSADQTLETPLNHDLTRMPRARQPKPRQQETLPITRISTNLSHLLVPSKLMVEVMPTQWDTTSWAKLSEKEHLEKSNWEPMFSPERK